MNIAHLMKPDLMIRSIFGEEIEHQEELEEKDGKRFKELREIINDIAEREEVEASQDWLYIGFGGGGIELSTNIYTDAEDEEEDEPGGDIFIHFDHLGNFTMAETELA